MIEKFGSGNYRRPSVNIYQNLKNYFIEKWKIEKSNSPKLEFYNMVKDTFDQERYLMLSNPDNKRSLVKLRCSSHRLNIEIGRYARPPIPRECRICKHCAKVYYVNYVDDEAHVIEKCPLYDNERNKFIENLSKIIGPNETAALLVKGLATIFKLHDDIRISRLQGNFIKDVFEKHKTLEEKRIPKPRKLNKRKR